ncbi:MAG: TRAP transporter small permease [Betaproteobacteria bacterium]|nr:TRAP transporter small permease [Betaproteobacteria bacterium]
MRSVFLAFERWSTAIAMAVACAMMALAASLGLYQIITRFVLERPAEWTEVLIRFSLIWMVFLGIPLAFRQGAMVSVDVLYRVARPSARRVLDYVIVAAAMVLLAVIVWWGWQYALRGRVQSVIGLEGVSMFWAYLALPVGGVFSLIAVIGNLLDTRRIELETAQ